MKGGTGKVSVKNRFSLRKSRPLLPVGGNVASGGRGLLPMLRLFALICGLSLLLTMVLFYLVTHRPESVEGQTSESGAEPPLPVDDNDGEGGKREASSVEAQLKPGKVTPRPAPVNNKFILSKMLEERQDSIPHRQGSVTLKPNKPPPGLHDSPFNHPKPPGNKESKMTPTPKYEDNKPAGPKGMPKPIDKGDAGGGAKPKANVPPGGRKWPPGPSPMEGEDDIPDYANDYAFDDDSDNKAEPTKRPTPKPKASPKPTPKPDKPVTRPPTPAPTQRPTPAPPSSIQKPKYAVYNRQAPGGGPPPLPVVVHDKAPKHGKVNTGLPERAALQDIENFIFSSTPVVNFSMQVSRESIENFEVALPNMVPNFRNPCWLEEVPEHYTYEDTAYKCHINYKKVSKGFDFMESVLLHRQMQGVRWRMRCMPAFFLLGVLKCGTNDMFSALGRHPSIMMPEIKEPEFWSRNRFEISPWLFKKDCLKPHKERVAFHEYLDIYDKPSETLRLSMQKRMDGSLYSDSIFGDYSSHTFVELLGWDKSLDAPRYVSAHHIHQMAPQTKFIIMLRDPVERAYSRYKMRFTLRQNVQGTAAEFHLRMLREVKDTLECMKTNSRRFCVYKENFGREGYHTMLVHGLYIVYLADWLSIVPREQMYVVRFEDYIQDRVEYVEDLAYFLGLGAIPENIKQEIESMPIPESSTHLGDMMNETRSLMREFYRPFNHELGDVLHDTRFRWGY